jgi:hypothetical protein
MPDSIRNQPLGYLPLATRARFPSIDHGYLMFTDQA